MALISFGEDEVKAKEPEEMSMEERMRASKTIADAKASQYIPPRMLAEMEASYGEVVVHDFNDDYNLSEEEKAAKNSLYKIFSKLGRCKRTYRKIDEFIEVARLSMEALNAVAENNGWYEPDEFKRRVFKGKIEVQGWMFPKLAGKEKKKVNYAYLADFIMSGEDPKSFVGINEDDEESIPRTNEEIIASGRKLFDPDVFARMCQPEDPEEREKRINSVIEDTTDPDQVPFDVVIINDDDDNKKFLKAAPESLDVVKDYRRKIKSSEQLQRLISDIDYDDFEAISKFDASISEKGSGGVEFHGTILDDDDYYEYISDSDEYAFEHDKINYYGRMRSPAEIQEAEFMNAIENAGWNIKNLFGNRERLKKRAEALKADKKRERRLRSQLERVSKRIEAKDKRRSLSDTFIAKQKKKKKKKKTEDD